MKKLIYRGENQLLSIIIRTKGQHNIHLQEWKTGGRNKNLEHILILGRISLSISKWICCAASNMYYLKKIHQVWYNVKFKEYYQ